VKKLLIGVAAAALLSSPVLTPQLPLLHTQQAHAQDAQVSISVFYERLAEHGSWISHPQHQYVWVPTDVDANWVPYSRGRWVNTEQYGWYFASDEPFAWAVYHYGRWGYDPQIGWFWVPGTRWAPAWVSWRRGDEYIGWAPLPPEGDGPAVSVEVSSAEPPEGYWVFVPVNEFVADDLTVVIVEREETPVIFERTELVGPVQVEDNIVVNNVIEVDFIRQHVDRDIEVMQVQEVQDPAEAAGSDGVVAFTGEISAEGDAAPAEAVEATEVESPTRGQEIEATGETTGEPAQDTEQAPTQDAEQPSDGQAEQAPGEETEQAPAESAEPTEEDTEQAPDEQTEQAPAGQESTEQPSGEGAEEPSDEQPAREEAPTSEQPDQGSPAEQQQAPTEDQPAEDQPAQDQPAQDQPAQDQPAEEQQAPAEDAAPNDQAPAQEAPSGEAGQEQEAPAGPAEQESPRGEQQQAPEGAEQAPAEGEQAPAEGAEEAPAQGEQAPAGECTPQAQQAGRC